MLQHIFAISGIVIILTGAAGVIADAAIIYGIFRFRRLRTIPNIFLANWAIANMLSIMILPTNLGVAMFGLFYEYLCLLVHATVTLHLAALLFGILLLFDWCTAVYYQRISEKLRKRYVTLIATLWSIVLLFYSLSAGLCISDVHYYFTVILFVIVYVINILIVIALQCSRIVQKFKANPITYPNLLTARLTVLTIITLSYLFGTIHLTLSYFDVYARHYNFIFTHIALILSAISVLSSSVVILGVVCWLDKDFRLCLFPKQNDLHERFENEVSEVEDNNKNSSPITYENPTHTVYTNHNNVN
ncbi:hypothetical protein ILUMI_12938 [Ignelater luminosus]|uniref:G-protein coupled receptors family 1 profile domain-containing protein n=1 Tax=Ignelater luminosus TaxID=2038154 RepID=A0A8K0GBB6_IGNLU|nr:hypothetical protein ILUMI_12938 [Ignelater luminosus]